MEHRLNTSVYLGFHGIIRGFFLTPISFNPFPPSFLRASSPEAAAPACGGWASRQRQGHKGKGLAGPRASVSALSRDLDTPRCPTPCNAGAAATRPAAQAPLQSCTLCGAQLVEEEVVDPPESYFGEETFSSSGLFTGFSDDILKRCRELVRGQRKALQRAHEKEVHLQRRRLAEESNTPTPSNDLHVFPEDDDLYEVRVKKEPVSSAEEEGEAEAKEEEKKEKEEEKEKEAGAVVEDASMRAGPYSLRKRKPTDYVELPLPDDDEFLWRALPCRYCSLSFTSPLFQEAHIQDCRQKYRNTSSADTANLTSRITHKYVMEKSIRHTQVITSLENSVYLYGDHSKKSACSENSSCGTRRANEKCDVDETNTASKDTQLCRVGGSTKSKLRRGKFVRTGERPHRCDLCGAKFNHSGQLKAHKRIHSGERPYRCEQCGAAFSQSGSLKTHKRIHSGERPYLCDDCGAMFTVSGDLNKHKRIHSGERPYRCERCGAAFSQSYNLKRHKRIHSGELPYRCEQCGAAFSQSGSLKRHKRIHSGERPYRCDDCGAKFTESGSLKRHKRIHSGER